MTHSTITLPAELQATLESHGKLEMFSSICAQMKTLQQAIDSLQIEHLPFDKKTAFQFREYFRSLHNTTHTAITTATNHSQAWFGLHTLGRALNTEVPLDSQFPIGTFTLNHHMIDALETDITEELIIDESGSYNRYTIRELQIILDTDVALAYNPDLLSAEHTDINWPALQAQIENYLHDDNYLPTELLFHAGTITQNQLALIDKPVATYAELPKLITE